ncbi:uncharacterized protein LOC108160032 isoform X2 [Drosophila miranda]|uniref:uncharacterized protein LOC108160032 isoform X2 n=1 Tax=Drosophila miranda TaxID=7229 RepID=UPI00143F66C8|nr:uncharacterized protein LOC108160032 isoform X2 [Drosophila miranda]
MTDGMSNKIPLEAIAKGNDWYQDVYMCPSWITFYDPIHSIISNWLELLLGVETRACAARRTISEM